MGWPPAAVMGTYGVPKLREDSPAAGDCATKIRRVGKQPRLGMRFSIDSIRVVW
jgi:hypothetical protein